MEAYLLDWANLLLRWLHLITGIAWIGASFYFVMLDNSLKPPKKEEDKKRGVLGELWAVHGGGFYNSQKFLLGPIGEPLTRDLHWSKWEAYTTWLSGFGLMTVIYYFGASSFLIDKNVMDLSPMMAIVISLGFLAIGWIFYDLVCRNMVGKDNLLAVIVFIFVVIITFALFHIFSARAAYLHVGAMLGTIMAANVFFHIMPGQRKMVAQIHAGEEVGSMPGIIGKQRSVHNTYFTLPVLFIMISNHYPMTYANKYGWLVLLVMILAGVLIRQYFVLRHRHQAKLWLPIVGVLLIGALIVVMAPKSVDAGGDKVAFSQIQEVLETRCVSCHAAKPTQAGFAQAPKGVLLETPEEVKQHAAKMAETVASGYMPIGNMTNITDEERALIAKWFAQGASVTD